MCNIYKYTLCLIVSYLYFKDVPITCQNNVPSESQEKTQPKEISRKKQISNGKTKLHETKKQITGE